MSRRVLVLRPEPGNAATVARLREAGLDPVALPLFDVGPVAWSMPETPYDALLLTSANTLRHGGAGLAALHQVPVVAVGEATAQAARDAGFSIVIAGTGDADLAAKMARAGGFDRLVRLGGRDRVPLDGVTDVTVYASEPSTPPPGALSIAAGAVALLHSPRAARDFAGLVDRDGVARGDIRLAALSAAVADAAGSGWQTIEHAPKATDAALVALAGALAIDH